MNWLLIYVLLALCLGLLVKGLARPGGIYGYPFLAAATFLGFALPQMPALAADPFLPSGAFNKTALVAILCAGACSLGWTAGRRPLSSLTWTFDERRLLTVAAALSAAGALFFFKISHLPKEMISATQWTGLPVAYLFLATVLNYGFVAAVYCFARRPSKFALSIILFDVLFYIDRIMIAGRRAETVEFLLIIALALWFRRGIAVPRLLVPLGIAFGALAITSTADYRAAANSSDGPDWTEVMDIDVLGNFEKQLETGGLEMRNAAQRIHFVDQSHTFDYGAYHWNRLVFNFVPAQIFGSAFKDSLLIPDVGRQFSLDYGSQVITGTTDTGIADAFASFWYLGAFKFFLIAYLLGRIYHAAVAGSTVHQFVYALSVTPAMHAVTHDTQYILSAWVHMAILFIPFLAFARVRTSLARFRWPSRRQADRATAHLVLDARRAPAE